MTIEYMMKNNSKATAAVTEYSHLNPSNSSANILGPTSANTARSSRDLQGSLKNNSTVETGIVFDEVCKIRVLDPAIFDGSEKLKDECQDFLSKMNALNEIVQTIIGAMQEQAQIVEDEKSKAIGLRNLIIKEKEARRHQQHSLQLQIKYYQSEVDKIMTQLESLSKVELEQQSMMDTLMGK